MNTVTVTNRRTDASTGHTVLDIRVLDYDATQLAKAFQFGTSVTVAFNGVASDDDIAKTIAAQYPGATLYWSVDERYAKLHLPAMIAADLREYSPDGVVVLTPLAEQIDSVTDEFLATLPPVPVPPTPRVP